MKWYHTVSAAGAALLVMACADRPSTGPDKAGPNLVVAGAGFTTTNPAYDNPTDDPLIELCLNGPGIINCNLYGAKEFAELVENGRQDARRAGEIRPSVAERADRGVPWFEQPRRTTAAGRGPVAA